MVRGKQKDDWTHTTTEIVYQINLHRDPKSQPVTFTELYPFNESEIATDKTDVPVHDMEELKALWARAT